MRLDSSGWLDCEKTLLPDKEEVDGGLQAEALARAQLFHLG